MMKICTYALSEGEGSFKCFHVCVCVCVTFWYFLIPICPEISDAGSVCKKKLNWIGGNP